MYLAKALETSTCSLKRLYLANGQIGTEGAVYLANALRNNETIQVLDLLHNPIGHDGVLAFRSILRNYQNVTIHALLLNHYDASTNGSIGIYLDLNRMGRRHIFDADLPVSVWPFLLEKMNSRPNLLYQTLLEKPELMKRE
eukprot:CAMPEP_0116867936 /NCGR_PEP_ID=MMETSP0418-20121206/26900_1 /TAXON_ID=1158023 /ORGANISM="Astrosyne radiata, Strain 13vi08-1A" /LENGTH=140 /DNA_ID=CAMNT_0004503815 /DNA_START=1 /DNA_END=423 /DNA_ORIENTATION=+